MMTCTTSLVPPTALSTVVEYSPTSQVRQAGGRRRRPNLGLVYVLLCGLCYLFSLDCGVLFYLV